MVKINGNTSIRKLEKLLAPIWRGRGPYSLPKEITLQDQTPLMIKRFKEEYPHHYAVVVRKRGDAYWEDEDLENNVSCYIAATLEREEVNRFIMRYLLNYPKKNGEELDFSIYEQGGME